MRRHTTLCVALDRYTEDMKNDNLAQKLNSFKSVRELLKVFSTEKNVKIFLKKYVGVKKLLAHTMKQQMFTYVAITDTDVQKLKRILMLRQEPCLKTLKLSYGLGF